MGRSSISREVSGGPGGYLISSFALISVPFQLFLFDVQQMWLFHVHRYWKAEAFRAGL